MGGNSQAAAADSTMPEISQTSESGGSRRGSTAARPDTNQSSSIGKTAGGDAKANQQAQQNSAKATAQSLNPLVLPSGEVRRLKKTSCPRGTTPPVLLRNPETPFFDPYNHECPYTDNTVHNRTAEYGGWTALHAAAASRFTGTHDKKKPVQGDVEQVRFLITIKGHHVPSSVAYPHYSSPAIDVDAKEVRRGWTALHVAVNAGHHEVVAELCKHKASVDAKDCLGRTALHLGCELNEKESVAHMLQERGGGAPYLGILTVSVGSAIGISVADREQGEMLNLIAEVTVTHRDPRDGPPPPQPKVGRRVDDGTRHRTLRCAPPVRITAGPDPFDTDFGTSKVSFRNCPENTSVRVRIIAKDMGQNEFQVAEWYGQREQLGTGAKRVGLAGGGKLVLKFKLVKNIDLGDENGVTPLHLAASAGSKECTQLLLDAGALTTIKDGFGGAAAMSAAVAGHGDVCRMIEDRGGVW